jgi:hypothetical protein
VNMQPPRADGVAELLLGPRWPAAGQLSQTRVAAGWIPDTTRPPVARRSRLIPPPEAGLSSSGALPRERWPSWQGRTGPRGLGRPGPSARASWSSPPIAGADGEDQRCEDRKGPGEARQVRLHIRLLWKSVLGSPIRPAAGRSSRGRSLALRPRLTTGLPWTVRMTDGTSVPSPQPSVRMNHAAMTRRSR